MNIGFDKMLGPNRHWKNMYSKVLSNISIQSIAKVWIGETVRENIVQAVAQDVREDLNKLLVEAIKYARRTRSVELAVEHLQFAAEEHDVGLNLVHVDFEPQDLEDSGLSMPTWHQKESILIKKKMKEENTTVNVNNVQLNEIQMLAPKTSEKQWMKRDKVLLMTNKKFPLSKEQQEFYILITETCMGNFEVTRRDALQRLRVDTSLQAMLPKLSLFIAEGVKVNLVQKNFAILMYLMRMVRALLCNSNLNITSYIHLLIPPVLSCTVAHQLCSFPAVQNHWALREFSSTIVSEIVKAFDNSENNILPRVMDLYKNGLKKASLTTIYGSIIGLGKIGKYAVHSCVIPQISAISELIEPYLTKDDENDENRQTSIYIRHRLLKMCAPILKDIHKPPDVITEYGEKYGILGASLYDSVIIERLIENVMSDDEYS